MGLLNTSVIVSLLLLVSDQAKAFKWTGTLLNGQQLDVCEGSRATFTWGFQLANGERVKRYIVFRTVGKSNTSDEELMESGEPKNYLINADPRFKFGPRYWFQIRPVIADDGGRYTLIVKVMSEGQTEVRVYKHTVSLVVKSSPAIIGDKLRAKVQPQASMISGGPQAGWHAKLSCGTFSSFGHPVVTVVWKTPSGTTLPSTSYQNGLAFLLVPTPVEAGPYTCQMDSESPALDCGQARSLLRMNSSLRLDPLETRLMLMEANIGREEEVYRLLQKRASRIERKLYCLQTKQNSSSCLEVRKCDPVRGVHVLNISGRYVSVYCDQDTDGGGWTLIQRRESGDVDFYRAWNDYVNGFGNTSSEYWLGLKNIHQLTRSRHYSLRVDLTGFDDSTAYAYYHTFSLGDPSSGYSIFVSGYNGTAGNDINLRENQEAKGGSSTMFSTRDRDNDRQTSLNCAAMFHSAWWYDDCDHAHLNGRYKRSAESGRDGLLWSEWKGLVSLKKVEMKIRPVV